MKLSTLIKSLILLAVAGFVLTGCISAKPQVEQAVEATPAPAPVADSDGDGVPDDKDACPDTPAGVKVDSKGCEIIFSLSGVNFAFDSSALTQTGEDVLSGVVGVIQSNPTKKFEIAGHTDSIGTEAYNMGLGERRANAVKAFFMNNGVDASRLTARSYGESQPIAPNKNDDGSDNPDGRAENRRVEIIDLGSN